MTKNEIANIIKKVYPLISKKYGNTSKVELHNNIYERLSGIKGMNGEYSPHGEYDWDSDKIYVYTNRMIDEEQVIKTLIHECVHSTQSKEVFDDFYECNFTYENHPLEIEARIHEKTWKKYSNLMEFDNWMNNLVKENGATKY
jgi:hypothetical protein